MATVTRRLERVLHEEAPSWGVQPVPPDVRRLSGLDFAVLWGDLGLGLLVLVTGALLVPALSAPQAFLAILLGSLIGCVPLALVGMAGAREGVPGMVLLRPTLGIRGSFVPTVLNIAQLVGWTAFEFWAMALVASRITGPLFGVDSFHVWLAVAAIVCLLLSLGGPVLVVRAWMERFGAWVIAAVAAWITFRLVTTADIGNLWAREGTGGFPTFWNAVDLVIVMPVSWIPLVADFNRFARRGVSSAGGTYAGYLLANVWFYSLGALLILGAGAPEPSVTGIADGIVALTGGTLLLIALLVGETDEAFADIYSAAVSTQNLAPRLNQRVMIVGVAAVGVAIGAWLFRQPGEGIFAYESFLFLIGSIFVPLFGVFVADYFVLKRRRRYLERSLFDPRGPYRFAAGFRLEALVAWILGFAAYHWVVPTGPAGWVERVTDLTGGPLFGGNAPASVISFAASFGVFLLLGLATRRRSPRAEGP
ncbi:MAG TPA: cytosine permease [Actinomycetota bacterium]|nr:cytosine permease [Actinomycetota bacterium]